ncbi:TrkA family potassium uptake protein, partial [Fulvivirga sp. RKSG066]|uniref:TrkA family potassium uptake protein n=1 Tax=Fulvivirga aurantia TaxID=2529383 RepID=UPI0016248B81
PVVVLTSSDAKNTEVVKRFKNEFNHEQIYSLYNPSLKTVAQNSEIKLIDKYQTMASQLEAAIVRPDTFQTLSEDFGAYQVEEIKMTNKKIDRDRVRNMAFHPSGSLVLMKRGTEMFVPHGDTHLLLGDIITVIGNGEALKDFRAKFI